MKFKQCKTHYGSLTVEASLVLPIFLYFFMAFLYFIQIFTFQEKLQEAITRTGLKLAELSYVQGYLERSYEERYDDVPVYDAEDSLISNLLLDKVLDEAILRLMVIRNLDEKYFNSTCIRGGLQGISFFGSSIQGEDDIIDIIVHYQVRIPVGIFRLKDLNMLQRVRLRGWTGYYIREIDTVSDQEEESKEEIVYVTETGTVYHISQNCTHLKLNIKTVNQVPYDLRNNNGAKYYACELCGKKNGDSEVYYITTEGTRYHKSKDCSGIKRTVKELDIKEIGNRRLCTRCGK